MKIIVYGAGGVGGYFGGKLQHAGYDVTLIARGKHLEAIQKNGLQVKSINGDFTVFPKATDDVSSISNPDLIVLGVKSWQIPSIANFLKPIINENTLVLPLQNGADNAEKLLETLDKKNVLAALCRIVSKVESPGVINHFAFEPEVVFAENDNKETQRVKKVKMIFDKAGFKNSISNDIHLDIWRKFLFITIVSGVGALTREVFGVLKQDESIRKIMIDSGIEIMKIANAKGISITQKDIDNAMKSFDNSGYNTTASMQRDFMDGKPSELENFNGYVVKQGLLLGIETPINSFIYHCLLPQENKARE
jgi:2-dehydropantoate 2-reductase|tara:strand:- start:37 stop:957 length:921 start_codon:yes stop_codon:yes gene_type:complete